MKLGFRGRKRGKGYFLSKEFFFSLSLFPLDGLAVLGDLWRGKIIIIDRR